MISLVRAGLNDGWDRLIAAVGEALRLGVTDSAAVVHILPWIVSATGKKTRA